MQSEKRETGGPNEKRLVEALRAAYAKRARSRGRRRTRAVAPVGHHESELSAR
jgi:hypothetical protein